MSGGYFFVYLKKHHRAGHQGAIQGYQHILGGIQKKRRPAGVLAKLSIGGNTKRLLPQNPAPDAPHQPQTIAPNSLLGALMAIGGAQPFSGGGNNQPVMFAQLTSAEPEKSSWDLG